MQESRDVVVDEWRYKGWNAVRLRRGDLELVVVPEVGGRVMGLRWRGQELYFTDPQLEGHVEDVAALADVRARKREMGFPLWGGEKTWLAPQGRWTEAVPFLDLDSGPYRTEVEPGGSAPASIRMTSRVCRETGVEITRTVRLAERADAWIVTHGLCNRGPNTVEWAPWGVSMVLRPGTVYLPRRADSVHPQGVKTFFEEGESATARESVLGELGELAAVRCAGSTAFKYGVDAAEGWMLAIVEVAALGLVGYRKQFPVDRRGRYGHGCVAEVFNSDRRPYFEMEVHGPVTRLAPGERCELEERQRLFALERLPVSEVEVRRHL